MGDDDDEPMGLSEQAVNAFRHAYARVVPPPLDRIPPLPPPLDRDPPPLDRVPPPRERGPAPSFDLPASARANFPRHQSRDDGRPHYWGHRERVRQRFEAGGATGIPDYEIVEMILFNAVPRVDVKPLAKKLLEDFGGFERLLTASRAELARHPHVDAKIVHQFKLSEAVAIRLAKAKLADKPIIGGTEAVIEYVRMAMGHQRVEHFRVLFMDLQNRLIADEEHGRGTVNHTPAYPREIAKRALELNAAGIILVHNHPSGDTTPSRADIAVTQKVEVALKALDIRLLDHVIIGSGTYSSLRGLGHI